MCGDDPFDELEEEAHLQAAGFKAVFCFLQRAQCVYVFVSACVWKQCVGLKRYAATDCVACLWRAVCIHDHTLCMCGYCECGISLLFLRVRVLSVCANDFLNLFAYVIYFFALDRSTFWHNRMRAFMVPAPRA